MKTFFNRTWIRLSAVGQLLLSAFVLLIGRCDAIIVARGRIHGEDNDEMASTQYVAGNMAVVGALLDVVMKEHKERTQDRLSNFLKGAAGRGLPKELLEGLRNAIAKREGIDPDKVKIDDVKFMPVSVDTLGPKIPKGREPTDDEKRQIAEAAAERAGTDPENIKVYTDPADKDVIRVVHTSENCDCSVCREARLNTGTATEADRATLN